MSDELFPIEEVTADSPRLAWMKRYGVITWYSADAEDGPRWYAGLRAFAEDFANEDHETHAMADADGGDASTFFFYELGECGMSSRCGVGATEEEALGCLAQRNGFRLWNEEGAMS